MAEGIRLQVPGGGLTVQDLRDFVGWAGGAGATSVRLADAQDLILDAGALVAPPRTFRKGDEGSLQSSAFDKDTSIPWLSAGVWLDLLADLPDPGPLDVQLVTPASAPRFVRWGHLRLTAQKAAHRWRVVARRPGSDRLLGRGEVDTGEVAALIAEAGWAHEAKRDQFWQGNPSEPAAEGPRRPRQTEGFLGEGQREFSFALALGAAWVPLTRLRALVWLAAETGASRAWVTPDGTLLFEGIPATGRQLWEDWLAASRMPETRGDLDRCVVAAGWGAGVVAARAEVLAALRRVAQMPPSRQLLVADDGLNRHDGVCSRPFPVLIRTTDSWLYRTGDGQNSGEGTLEEALEGLEAPGAGGVAPGEASQGTLAARFRCGSCLSVYDQRYGDPLGGVGAGIPFENLSPTWCCPVCGASRTIFLPAED